MTVTGICAIAVAPAAVNGYDGYSAVLLFVGSLGSDQPAALDGRAASAPLPGFSAGRDAGSM